MVERGFGHVLNLASIGAYQPSPLYASYSAAKSFVLNFTEALSYELRGTGVHATALSPGVVATEFLQVAAQAPTATSGAAGWTARRSPASAWTPCSGGRPTLVAGWRNAAAAWSVRLLPRRTAAALAHRAMR
jgi:short-subunit dehydrogenase